MTTDTDGTPKPDVTPDPVAVARQAIEDDQSNRVNAAMTEIQEVMKRHRVTLGAKINKVQISKGVWADSAEVTLTAIE